MLDPDDPGHCFGRRFGRQRFCGRADHGCMQRLVRLRGKMLAGRQGFPTGAAYAAVAFFQDNKNTAHRTRTSNFSFSTRAAAASFAVPGRIWVERCFCGRATDSSTALGAFSTARSAAGDTAEFLRLGALDAHQCGVAKLVAARLDRQHRGQGKLDGLEPAVFQFAFHAQAGLGLLHLQDQRGVRQAQKLGKDHARLAQTQVVGLQSREDQVGDLGLDGFG